MKPSNKAKIFSAVLLALLLLHISALIFSSSFGFNLKDESLYILDFSYYSDIQYFFGTSYFLLLGPIFQALNNDILLFRILTIAFLSVPVYLLSSELSKSISSSWIPDQEYRTLNYFLFNYNLSLLYFSSLGLLTASYNYLVTLAGYFFVAGILALYNKKHWFSTSFIFSAALFFGYFGKITTFFSLTAFLFFLALLFRYWKILYSLPVFLVLLLFWFEITGLSLTDHLDFILSGIDIAHLNSTGHHPFRLLLLLPMHVIQLLIPNFSISFTTLISILIGCYIMIIYYNTSLKIKWSVLFMCILFSLIGFAMIYTSYSILGDIKWVMDVMVILFIVTNVGNLEYVKKFSVKQLVMAYSPLIILLGVHIGTNNPLESSASMNLLLIFTSVILIDRKTMSSQISVLIIFAMIISLSALSSTLGRVGFKSGSLESHKVVELSNGSVLKVNSCIKGQIDTLERLSAFRRQSINKRLKLLNLTGDYPGLNLLIDADIVGRHWYVGVYDDTEAINVIDFDLALMTDSGFKNLIIAFKPYTKRSFDPTNSKYLGPIWSDFELVKVLKDCRRNEEVHLYGHQSLNLLGRLK